MSTTADPPAPSLLSVLDSLCGELRASCGLTRFSIVLDRRAQPLTISYEDGLHASVPLGPTAYLEIEISDGSRAIGYVTLENARRREYPASAWASASAAVSRYGAVLRRALGPACSSLPPPDADSPMSQASGGLRTLR